MPIHELTESDLKAYRDKLSNHTLPSAGSLSQLSFMYSRFQLNEQNLIDLEYRIERIRIENRYQEEKQNCQNKLAELKKQYKQVDNRITSVEQKLSRGIPEDLDLVEKLIAEQEAIIGEQEKLNASESALTERISAVDVAYGKAREKLTQGQIAANVPLKTRFEAYTAKLDKTDQEIKMSSNLIALIPVIGIPLLIEFTANKIGLPVIASKTIYHGVYAHYLFFIALILTHFFLTERIRSTIYALMAVRKAKIASAGLLKLLTENSARIAVLEKKSGMKVQQIHEITAKLGL